MQNLPFNPMKERNCYRRWGRRRVPPGALPFFLSSASEKCVFSPPSLVSVLKIQINDKNINILKFYNKKENNLKNYICPIFYIFTFI